MKNCKASHSKNGDSGIPVSIIKNWLSKTERILWAIEEKQDKATVENKKIIEKMDERIEENKQMIVELKKANQEQKEINKKQTFLNSIFSREILKKLGWTDQQIDKLVDSKG